MSCHSEDANSLCTQSDEGSDVACTAPSSPPPADTSSASSLLGFLSFSRSTDVQHYAAFPRNASVLEGCFPAASSWETGQSVVTQSLRQRSSCNVIWMVIVCTAEAQPLTWWRQTYASAKSRLYPGVQPNGVVSVSPLGEEVQWLTSWRQEMTAAQVEFDGSVHSIDAALGLGNVAPAA